MTITAHGKVGSQPEIRFTGGGMAVTEFRLAVTSGKDDKKKTTWHSVKTFGKLAENVAGGVNKGDTVLVTGRIEDDEYTKKDGTKGTFRSLIADEVGMSLRWNVWVKDQTEQTMAQIGQVGKSIPSGRPAPLDMGDEEPF